jgi:mono/diheme cytochrome c family protein
MALFVPACGLIGVHLFLALVNPPTRRALSGMFLGHVSADYAKAHHRLWAGEPDRPDEHQALISRPVLSAVLVVLVLGAVGLGWLYGPERLGSRVTAVWQSRGRLLLMPGDLCASHARDPGNDKCGACHVMWGRTPSALCLECHRRIEQVQAGRLGYHGRLAGECRDCHGDHKGVAADVRNLDQSAFNHNRANYPLEGRHRELSCEACHLVGKEPGPEQQRYIGLQFGACVDCHTNPHTDPAALNCARCHIVQGWRRPLVLFDHNRDSRFLLEGQHALTPCDRCHRRPSPLLPSAPFELYNVGRTCADCHKDVHEGTLGRDCQHCHTAAAWGGRELVFNHNHDSKYVLAGRHGAVDCAKCHRPPEGQSLGMAKFTGLETRCAACHQDPHGGQFKKSCEECHGVEGWKGPQLKFIHNRDSDYVLDAVHGGLSCASCHRGQPAVVYRPVARNCAGCHGHANMAVEGRLGGGSAQPDPHAGRVSCEKCHDMSKRRPGLADYAKACGQCHGPRYEDLLYDWARALHDRQASAERLLAEVRRKGSADADSMARKIQEAKVVGLHNFQQARKMWDDILGPASSKGQDP